MKYFHEEVNEIIFTKFIEEGKSWDDVTSEYSQPKWCGYPEALSPLGCWGLTSFRVNKEYCSKCDCNMEVQNEQV